MKIFFAFIFVCFLLTVPVFGQDQTAVEMERLLETTAVKYDTAAYFVLRSADVSNPARPEDAFRFAEEHRWLPQNAAPDDTAELEAISLLLMKSFDIKGGLLYSLFRNSHYAYRELVYQEVIQGRADPDVAVSGDMLLFLIGRLLSRREVDTGVENR